MPCTSCSSSVIDSICGCGTSCNPWNPSWSISPCPAPPPIPPCGQRVLSDGSVEDVWNPTHRLIPRFRREFAELDCIPCDSELANLLYLAEENVNTCRFPGESYYRHILLSVASMIEYKEAIEIYRAARSGAIANKTQQIKFPSKQEGYYAELLKDLEMQYPVTPSAIFI